MFPLGLAAFINRQWANSGGWEVFAACIAVYLIHAGFISARELCAPHFFCLASLRFCSSAMFRDAGR